MWSISAPPKPSGLNWLRLPVANMVCVKNEFHKPPLKNEACFYELSDLERRQANGTEGRELASLSGTAKANEYIRYYSETFQSCEGNSREQCPYIHACMRGQRIRETMDWSNDQTLSLIELYRSKPCLWDPKDNNYRIKSVKNDAWNDISETLKCSLDEAKRKMESVLASFRRERQRQLKAGTDGGYNSSWFAFKHMQFLMDKFQTRFMDNDDFQLLEDDTEIDNCSIADEKPDLNIVTEEPVSTASACVEREDMPQEALPQKKRYLQRARARVLPYKVLHDSAARRPPRDESAVFGEYIAMKLRHYSAYTRNVVQHLISNIVFEADMGKYNESSHSDNHMCSPFVVTQVSSPSSSV